MQYMPGAGAPIGSSSGALSGGTVVGVAVGSVCGVLLLAAAALAVVYVRWRSGRRTEAYHVGGKDLAESSKALPGSSSETTTGLHNSTSSQIHEHLQLQCVPIAVAQTTSAGTGSYEPASTPTPSCRGGTTTTTTTSSDSPDSEQKEAAVTSQHLTSEELVARHAGLAHHRVQGTSSSGTAEESSVFSSGVDPIRLSRYGQGSSLMASLAADGALPMRSTGPMLSTTSSNDPSTSTSASASSGTATRSRSHGSQSHGSQAATLAAARTVMPPSTTASLQALNDPLLNLVLHQDVTVDMQHVLGQGSAGLVVCGLLHLGSKLGPQGSREVAEVPVAVKLLQTATQMGVHSLSGKLRAVSDNASNPFTGSFSSAAAKLLDLWAHACIHSQAACATFPLAHRADACHLLNPVSFPYRRTQRLNTC